MGGGASKNKADTPPPPQSSPTESPPSPPPERSIGKSLPDPLEEKLRSKLCTASPAERRKIEEAIDLVETDAVPSSRMLFVGANWKCSLESMEQVVGLLSQLAARWPGGGPPGVELCIFAPYVFLDRARQLLPSGIHVGSQNAWDAAEGFGCTGATTAAMIKAVGCSWVLLGHSDRRNVLGETDSLISEKVKRCLESGLNVNITIGEKLEARERGEELTVLQQQLAAAAEGVPVDAWSRVAVAYEPVWAVGEGAMPCSPEETQRVHSVLRSWLRDQVGHQAAKQCRFLYTGSVNEKNAEQYSKLPDVDGFVVGRAGLDIDKLSSVCETLFNCKRDIMSELL